MAHRGSLFVLHLKMESKVLIDRRGIMPGLLHRGVLLIIFGFEKV